MALLRWRYAILVVCAAGAAFLVRLPPGHDDWYLFIWGARLLFGDHPMSANAAGGLHTFANYRTFQIGPLTLALVALLRALWGDNGSRAAAITLMTVMGPAIVAVLERAATVRHGSGDWMRYVMVLLGGAVVVVAWSMLGAHYVHLDDALTLFFACLAILAVTLDRPSFGGAMIGLATAAKPWGIIVLPLVLVFQGRARLRAIAWSGAVISVTWLPFVIADAGTLSAGKAQVATSAKSVIHLFGVSVGSSPSWVRPGQLGLALVLGALAVRTGRWPAVLLLGIAVRILFDPGVFEYYTSGFVVAAFAWEILRSRRPLPLVTMMLFWLLLLPSQYLDNNVFEASLRLVACVGTVVVVGLVPPSAPRVKWRAVKTTKELA